ncbi:MAG TPA: AarF/ABC1/UbiB kinase family protein [Ktedonobacterales bacterium]|nr:AarF/ABC1/UbiB kinase family protein [Ktedonobacterales bacterium]
MGWQPVRWTRRNRIWRTYRVARLLFRTLWIMYRERNRVMRARARGELDARPDIAALQRMLREFRQTAIALGGLLIKLGQFLSARADLLPAEALAELAQLQDEVPAESFADIQRVIERELKAPLDDIFTFVERTPAGSASLGQVHRAQLKDGRLVAVKVQRPGIGQIVRTDLSTLRFVLEVVRRLSPTADAIMDLRGLHREFTRTVQQELDYQREGHNAERFARLFAEEADISVPAVLWQYSTRSVLTLEWMGGVKITNITQLDAIGVNREKLATRLIGTYFKQVLELGFFHADPHPGNIFVQMEPDGARLNFVDFGMMGSITPRMKEGVRDCFLGVVRQDGALVTRGLEVLGFIGERANREAIEQAIMLMLGQFSNVSFGELRQLDPGDILSDVEMLLYDQPLRLPANFAFLGRALSMLVGLATTLSPEFNFMEAATPYANQFMRQDGFETLLRLFGASSAQQLGRDLVRESVALARSVSSIPRTLERVLERAERGDLRLIIESPTLDPRLRRRIRREMASGLLNRPVPAWVPLGLVGVLWLTIVARRRNGHG